MHAAVRELVETVGLLHDGMSVAGMERADALLRTLPEALDAGEVRALMALFAPTGDTANGLAWSLLHAVEASPAWPVAGCLDDLSNDWVRIFRCRLENGGYVETSLGVFLCEAPSERGFLTSLLDRIRRASARSRRKV